MRSISRVKLVVVLLSAFAVGCPKRERLAPVTDKEPRPATEMGRALPEILPKPIPRIRARVDPKALPEGARARFPVFEGDPFFVSLPQRPVGKLSAQDARREALGVLRAMGFTRELEELGAAPAEGVPTPTGNLSELAEVACLDLPHAQLDKVPERLAAAQAGCAALRGERPSDEGAKAFREGTGMDLEQYRADVERQEIRYPIRQLVGGVPIEHTIVVATRREGLSVGKVSGRFLNRFAVANRPALKPEEAARRAPAALKQVRGIDAVLDDVGRPPVELLLLPYGGARDAAGNEVPALRHVYRMVIQARSGVAHGPWQLWLDAETGEILELHALVQHEAAGQGRTYRRAPDTLSLADPLEVPLRVDDSSGGQYVLQLSSVLNRIANPSDGQVSISNSTLGSSAAFANFDQATAGLNDGAGAACNSDPTGGAAGADENFQQVSAFGTLWKARAWLVYGGIYTPFPPSAWNVQVEDPGAGCNAWGSPAGFSFGACAGYYDAACPGAAVGWMNAAHDNTIVVHELGHAAGPRMGTGRPADWCGAPPCPVPSPSAYWMFHDFADALADVIEGTNCTSGWFAKDGATPNSALNCATHTEGGGLPRLHQVSVPFDPGTPGDHFPEHRALAAGGYADGQIAAAVLWLVREGLSSRSIAAGPPQFMVRWMRSMHDYGFFSASCGGCDSDIYRYLVDLETQLVEQWATSGLPGGPPALAHDGPASTNKVTAAFARAGVFALPHACIDGDTATADPTACPAGENGADAVIDVDDGDTADDLAVLGAPHLPIREVDYLKSSGSPPLFHVWTGPRYRFAASGAAAFPNPSPCNARFQVEVASDAAFTTGLAVSGFITVDTNPTTAAAECYGAWTLPAGAWNALKAGPRIYYRVRTQDASGGNERISTSPAAGLFTVPPSYALVNASGREPAVGQPPVLPPQLVVNEVVVPPADPGRFDLRIDGVTAASGVGNGGSTGARTVTAGAHQVSEVAAAGTNLADYAVSFGLDCNATGAVSVAQNELKVCTVTSTRLATLTVRKALLPSTDPGRFDLRVNGRVVASGAGNGAQSAPIRLVPGNYRVTERAVPPADLADYKVRFTGDCRSDGTITLAPGDSKVCTVVNRHLPTRAECLADCRADRDACFAEVGHPGGLLPRQCAQMYQACLRRCPP